MLLAVTLVVSARQARVAPHIVTAERLGILNATDLQSDYFQPSDAQIAFVLSRFIEDIRSLSTDPVVVRSKWARAFDMTTDRGAEALKAYARNSGRFASIGVRAITAEVTSIVRASNEFLRCTGRSEPTNTKRPCKRSGSPASSPWSVKRLNRAQDANNPFAF